MKIRNRLIKLERQMGRSFRCPHCQDSPIGQICLYELQPDGTERLTEGTPRAPCPACGKVPPIIGLVAVPPALRKDSGQCYLLGPWIPQRFAKDPLRR